MLNFATTIGLANLEFQEGTDLGSQKFKARLFEIMNLKMFQNRNGVRYSKVSKASCKRTKQVEIVRVGSLRGFDL